MYIPFIEPVSPRYIHINSETNKVHLMVPIVSGQEISTDNTCKATRVLRKFFDKKAVHELTAYKNALAFDIELLEEGNPQRILKEDRLFQIEAYIEAVLAMQQSYGQAIYALMNKTSNLYEIQLKPHIQDPASRVINPAFHVERKNDSNGTPLSALYNAIYRILPNVVISPGPRDRLTREVVDALRDPIMFEDIQRVLREQCQRLFNLTIDFTKNSDGSLTKRTEIDALMGFGTDATVQNYIDALLGICASEIWDSIPTSAFYNIPMIISVEERTERLSILTQFFLANLTVYCKAIGISTQDFGKLLDASPILSDELISAIASALSKGEDVEDCICTFFKKHSNEFGLSRLLSNEELTAMKQKFARMFLTVTATKENPHMDDFMILDMEATGKMSKFVTHQGAICVNFAEIIDFFLPNQEYFAEILNDFAIHPIEIPHKNEWVAGGVEKDPEELLVRFNDEQFENFPQSVKDECHAHPLFQYRLFLHYIAQGKQEEAEALLNFIPSNTQTLIQFQGVFTDYSGRTFNCTAYEYAYWAKDTHMCRMLDRYMNEETKVQILARIAEMDRIDTTKGQPLGLKYQQNGKIYRSHHFDFTPLKQALQHYVDGYHEWYGNNWVAMEDSWMAVGKAQRDLPAHVAQEYCRRNRPFAPLPQFNEATLPRDFIFYNFNDKCNESWFPLPPDSGLGYDFALIRGGRGRRLGGGCAPCLRGAYGPAKDDLAAIIHLDEVRTVELTQLRENLKPQPSAFCTIM